MTEILKVIIFLSGFIHLTDGNVIVNDEQMKTIDGHHVNGLSIICIKKQE